MIIRVHRNLAALSRAAADLFCDRAGEAVRRRGRCDVALAGGDTPRLTYALLATAPWRDRVDWGQVHVFWGDERCVAPDDARSNARMARETLLDRVPIPPDHIHPICGTEDPPRAAAAYEEELRRHFGEEGPPGWDLVLLGLGEDGHTASLFPGGDAVRERERWVAAVLRPDSKPHRISLTPAGLNGAALAVFLVAGGRKAAALRAVRHQPPDPERCPAQIVTPRGGEPLFLIDREAAGEVGGAISTDDRGGAGAAP